MRAVPALIEALETQVTVGRGVRTAQLSLDSPCLGWTVRDVMSHSIGVTLKFADFAASTTDCPHAPVGDLVGADHVVALDAALQAARGAWSVADMGRSCHLPFGTFPADVIAGINLFDVLAHSWDIATSTGVDLDCPDELWSTGLAAARALIGLDRDLRHDAAAVSVGRDESPRARFPGFLGRSDADQRARR